MNIVNESIVTEGRDAYLYHGTQLATALQILQSNELFTTQDTAGPKKVSLSRDPRTARAFGSYWGRVYPVVFVLDQAKIAQNFKLEPYADHDPSGNRRDNEHEEIIMRDLKPLSRYLVSINVNPEHLKQALSRTTGHEYREHMMHELHWEGTDEEFVAGIKALAENPLLNRVAIRVPTDHRADPGVWADETDDSERPEDEDDFNY